jgi:hypothetical protein
VLTPEQAAIWDKDQTEKRLKVDQDINAVLAPSAKQVHDREAQKAQAFCQKAASALSLDTDSKEKLQALAEKAVDQAVDQWRARTGAVIRADPPDPVGKIITLESIYGIALNDDFTEQPVWKSGITDILSDSALKKLGSFSDKSVTDRVSIMGRVLVVIMDQKVGLTTAQRTQLKAISERLVKNDEVLCPALSSNNNTPNSSVNYVYNLAKKATDDELKPILDATQLARWRADPFDQENAPPVLNPTVQLPPAPETDKEPEHVEQVLSRMLYNNEKAEHQFFLDRYSLKTEKIIRILSPTPEQAEKLRLTVLCLVEKQMFNLKLHSEQQLRSQLTEITPDNIDECLHSVANYLTQVISANAGNYNMGDVELGYLVRSMFSKDQIEALQKESEARQSFDKQTICEVITSDFARYFYLDDEQRKRLAPLLEKVMNDYGDDLLTVLYTGDILSWFANPRMEFIPILGISEADLKAVLNDDQFKEWALSQEHSTSQNYWPELEQFHHVRLQNQRPGTVHPLRL